MKYFKFSFITIAIFMVVVVGSFQSCHKEELVTLNNGYTPTLLVQDDPFLVLIKGEIQKQLGSKYKNRSIYWDIAEIAPIKERPVIIPMESEKNIQRAIIVNVSSTKRTYFVLEKQYLSKDASDYIVNLYDLKGTNLSLKYKAHKKLLARGTVEDSNDDDSFWEEYYSNNQLGEVIITGNTRGSFGGWGGSFSFNTSWFYNGINSFFNTIPNYGNYGGGGGGSSSPNNDTPNNDAPNEIINKLKDKADCVYRKLTKNSANFKKMIKKFDGDFPVSHLKFEESSNLPLNTNAKTSPPSNYIITIRINSNNLNRPNLSIARTIIHETIHAEMFRKILSIIDNGGDLEGLSRGQWISKLSNGDYPGIFDYYSRYGVNGMQHEQMAAHYISTISNYLKQFQPGLSQEIYDSLAWVGLKETTAWNSLALSKRTTINKTISTFNRQGSENCN